MRMKLKFTCRNCKKTGFVASIKESDFIHVPWYTDYKGLIHGCLYCRSCGAVHDTIGPLLGAIKYLFRRVPSKVTGTYEFSAFKRLLIINNPDFITPIRLPYDVVEAMIEDGRLAEEDDALSGDAPTLDFLLECLTDRNSIVRREAIISLRRFKDKQAVGPLIEALKDRSWDVRRNAAITLGDIGDSEAIEPLNELLRAERREHLVRKEGTVTLRKLKGL